MGHNRMNLRTCILLLSNFSFTLSVKLTSFRTKPIASLSSCPSGAIDFVCTSGSTMVIFDYDILVFVLTVFFWCVCSKRKSRCLWKHTKTTETWAFSLKHKTVLTTFSVFLVNVEIARLEVSPIQRPKSRRQPLSKTKSRLIKIRRKEQASLENRLDRLVHSRWVMKKNSWGVRTRQ